MTQHPGKPAGSVNPRELDVFEFARSGRQAAGAVRVSQLPRMLNEVPAEAPDRDAAFTWQAEGSTQPELQDELESVQERSEEARLVQVSPRAPKR